jgi:energy-coupling factor transporter ATP-binding protein EcfA2
MSTSETTAVSQPKNITAVFIGRTGSGKSTLANTVAGEELFEASEASTSVTETVDAQTVPLEWNKTKYNLKLVDTIGIGDTDRNADDVMRRLADVCHECKDGINAMYFVTRGRFTKEEAEAFDIMWQVIFGAEVCKYTTIVRTDFPNFKDAVAVEDDIGKLKSGGRPSQRVFELVTNTPIYVDNPPLVYGEISSKSREESRKRICNHLTFHANDVFKPPLLEEVHKRISDKINEERELKEKAKELEEKLKTAELSVEQLQRTKEEQEKAVRELQASLTRTNDEMRRLLQEKRSTVTCGSSSRSGFPCRLL